MKRLRDILSWPSRFLYWAWLLGLLRGSLDCKLRSGQQLTIRKPPVEDLPLAWEIFVTETYKFPWPLENVRRVVDLGANVGYSALYFSGQFPKAHIDAFEPHPVHLQQLRELVVANHLENRVTVHPVAAGSKQRTGFLSDAGCSSTVAVQGIPITVIDWFSSEQSRSVDLLKVDIEGSESELIADPRISHLKIPYVVVEWHGQVERLVHERLVGLGYEVQCGRQGKNSDGSTFGLVYGRLTSLRTAAISLPHEARAKDCRVL